MNFQPKPTKKKVEASYKTYISKMSYPKKSMNWHRNMIPALTISLSAF